MTTLKSNQSVSNTKEKFKILERGVAPQEGYDEIPTPMLLGGDPGQEQVGILTYLVRFLILPLHWIAVIFEVFLHIKFGRTYINPLYVIFSILLFLVIFMSIDGWVGVVLGTGLGLSILGFAQSFPYFYSMAFILMIAHYIHARINYNKYPVHSRSSGVPWIFFVTRNDFFKSNLYINYFEPIVVLMAMAFLYIVLDYDKIIYFSPIILLYIIRNVILQQVSVSRNIARIDARIIHQRNRLRDAEIEQDQVDNKGINNDEIYKMNHEESNDLSDSQRLYHEEQLDLFSTPVESKTRADFQERK